jgi:hypothetical protein
MPHRARRGLPQTRKALGGVVQTQKTENGLESPVRPSSGILGGAFAPVRAPAAWLRYGAHKRPHRLIVAAIDRRSSPSKPLCRNAP